MLLAICSTASRLCVGVETLSLALSIASLPKGNQGHEPIVSLALIAVPVTTSMILFAAFCGSPSCDLCIVGHLCNIWPTGPFSQSSVSPTAGVTYEPSSQFVRNRSGSIIKILTLNGTSCKVRPSEIAAHVDDGAFPRLPKVWNSTFDDLQCTEETRFHLIGYLLFAVISYKQLIH